MCGDSGSDPTDPLCSETEDSSYDDGALNPEVNLCYGLNNGSGWNETCIRLLCAGSATCTGYFKILNFDTLVQGDFRAETRFFYRGTPTGEEDEYPASHLGPMCGDPRPNVRVDCGLGRAIEVVLKVLH